MEAASQEVPTSHPPCGSGRSTLMNPIATLSRMHLQLDECQSPNAMILHVADEVGS